MATSWLGDPEEAALLRSAARGQMPRKRGNGVGRGQRVEEEDHYTGGGQRTKKPGCCMDWL